MSIRTERVASLIKHEVSQIIMREMRDELLVLVTVTDVRVSADLKVAKIYVSVFNSGNPKQQAMDKLAANQKTIRSELGSRLRLKFTPEVHFFLDETLDRVERIEGLIKEIRRKDG
jgi:ribosome-binding factor A